MRRRRRKKKIIYGFGNSPSTVIRSIPVVLEVSAPLSHLAIETIDDADTHRVT